MLTTEALLRQAESEVAAERATERARRRLLDEGHRSGAGWSLGAASAALNAMLASPAGDALARWTADTFNHNSTPYDAAIDAVYNETHIGGSVGHHLVDGQHSIAGAFEAAAGALPNDSLLDEVSGAVEHLLRDLASVSGINPVMTMSPDTLVGLQDTLQGALGVSRSWTTDALTINAPEVLGGFLGLLPLLFGWRTADAKRFARLAGHLGIAAILSANPLLGVVALAGAARAFHKSTVSVGDLVASGAKGAAISGLMIAAMNVLPATILIGLIAGVLLMRFGLPLKQTIAAWLQRAVPLRLGAAS